MTIARLVRFASRIATYGVRRILRPAVIRHGGVRLAVDPRVLSPAMVARFYSGVYERDEADLIRSTLAPDDRVLELGGGVGFIGTIAALAVRDPAQVLIVEANPQLIPLMERNFNLNGVKPVVWNGVLGRNGATEVSFYVHADFWASSLTPFSSGRETKVMQRDIRDVLTEFRPTYIILDIEGGEIDLFKDLSLAGVRKICIEIHPAVSGKAAVGELFASFGRQGFAIEHMSRSKNVVFFRRAA